MCAICKQIARDPVFFTDCPDAACSHKLYCKSCAYQATPHNTNECPQKHWRPQAYKHPFNVQEHFRLRIQDLPILCPYGCPVAKFDAVPLIIGDKERDLINHIDHCERVVVSCPQRCDKRFARSELPYHQEQVCKYRKVKCKLCGDKYVFAEELLHFNDASEVCINSAVCPDGCYTQMQEGTTSGIYVLRPPDPTVYDSQPTIVLKSAIASHLKLCPERRDTCDQYGAGVDSICGERIRYDLLQHHQLTECKKRRSKCPICEIELPYDELTDHQSSLDVDVKCKSSCRCINKCYVWRQKGQSNTAVRGAGTPDMFEPNLNKSASDRKEIFRTIIFSNDLELHRKVCPLEKYACVYCRTNFARFEFNQHFANEHLQLMATSLLKVQASTEILITVQASTEKAITDAQASVGKEITDVQASTVKQIADVQASTVKQIADSQASTEKQITDVQTSTEKLIADSAVLADRVREAAFILPLIQRPKHRNIIHGIIEQFRTDQLSLTRVLKQINVSATKTMWLDATDEIGALYASIVTFQHDKTAIHAICQTILHLVSFDDEALVSAIRALPFVQSLNTILKTSNPSEIDKQAIVQTLFCLEDNGLTLEQLSTCQALPSMSTIRCATPTADRIQLLTRLIPQLKTIAIFDLKTFCRNVPPQTLTTLIDQLSTMHSLTALHIGSDILSESGTNQLAQAIPLLKNLTTLDIRDKSIVQQGCALLAAQLTHLLQLKSLILTTNCINHAAAVVLTTSLKRLVRLTHLSLKDNGIDDVTLTTIVTCFTFLPMLETIDLERNAFSDKGARALIADCRYLPSLSLLDLSSNGLTHVAMENLASIGNMTSLVSLILSGNFFKAAYSQSIAHVLCQMPTLTALDLSGTEVETTSVAHALPHIRLLRTLLLCDNKIGDSGSTALAERLCFVPSLTVLRLSQNKIRQSGIAALAAALPKTLAVFDIGGNYIGDVGNEALCNAVGMMPSMTTLYLDRNGISEQSAHHAGSALAKMPLISALHLNSNDLTASGIQTLARCLIHLSGLRILNFQATRMGDGMKFFAPALRHVPRLTTLYLQRNELADNGVIMLAKHLSVLSKLSVLHLDENDISAVGARALASALRHVPALSRLSLHRNHIGNDGVDALVDQLADVPLITLLKVSDNNIDKAVEQKLSTSYAGSLMSF